MLEGSSTGGLGPAPGGFRFVSIVNRLANRKESEGRLINRYKSDVGGQITNAKQREQARFFSAALDWLKLDCRVPT
ncbi:hypothetical protein, partial [Burkholderia gladioli]|uniref:hypothetical protein n=1 Tax=Burkholderia gladioli TaxID=28095 RepID=UPI003F7A640A